ncbi:CHAT domain-containing protein [Talaromyces proteolyticus]|uniref:CHAT domain-containing protein n=1 Tax=Talaromyces proteolyticus TaxID=1131652 RepID=A0AAD4PRU0_9EURO|nr:CHAT domain-containing protein [Talaromyces proteolyticus]KAH8689815.1 CHAT domain-containing protein [Talaromyces proteolyticus]
MTFKALSPNHPERAQRVYSIAGYFRQGFSRTGELLLIEKAIHFGRIALETMPENHPRRPEFLNNLGVFFQDRFSRKGDVEDIKRAAAYTQQALISVPDGADSRDRIDFTSNLGVYYEKLFRRTGKMQYLDQAIDMGQSCIDGPPNHPNRAGAFNNLARHLRTRYQILGDQGDLETALSHVKHSLSLTPDNHGKRGERLSNLSSLMYERYLLSHNIDELDGAVTLAKQALDCSSENYSHRSQALNNLGKCLQLQFKRNGKMTDLEEAIRLGELAVDAVPLDDYANRSLHLHNLSTYYHDRFLRTGRVEDLQNSIHLMQKAIDATPEDDPDMTYRLHGLGILFQERYLRIADSKDIEEAIRVQREAVERIPVGHRSRGHCLNNLGYFILLLSSRTGKIDDLEEAIEVAKKGLDVVPKQHSGYATALDNLGICYADRYDRVSELSDLEESIRLGREALEATPENHPGLIYRWNNLGSRLADLFSVIPSVGIINEAIDIGQKALCALPENHYFRAQLLYNLGARFKARFGQSKSENDLRESTRLFCQALHSHDGEPMTRIKAGITAALDMNSSRKWGESASILQESLDLLPRATLRTGSRSDLQHTIPNLAGVSALAASVFLKAGKSPLQALQILEQGRGIIAGLVIDSRSDVSLLRKKHPDLYSRYDYARKVVAIPFSSGLSGEDESFSSLKNNYTLESLQRHEYSVKLEEVIQEIRENPGFERFQLPLTKNEILHLARGGPLVSFNVSVVSSEAFIVTENTIQALPLPELKKSDVQQMMRSLVHASNGRRRDAKFVEDVDDGSFGMEDELQPVEITSQMSTLWANAVKPVVKSLGFLIPGKTMQELPRIWWVGGGLMSALPLHAAGNHHPGSTDNTLTYAVSSFAPTLKSLQFSRSTAQTSPNAEASKLLIVSMPTTPDIAGRLNVTEEVAAIESTTKQHSTVKTLKRPAKQDVLAELKSASICHFACHGRADALEPAKSALLLGNTALEELSISDLDAIYNPRAQIAYLSACSTAELGEIGLIDESIHLASTFSLAGFPHVIGTLWGAVDSAAVDIARAFYRELFVNDISVAYALHKAVVRLRNEDAAYILKWAPFIHIGA